MAESSTHSNSIELDIPGRVFHYTSLEAMTSIIRSKSIWCTAIPYLNDSQERSFLLDAVKRRLPELKKNDTTIDQSLLFPRMDAADVSNATTFAEEQFVACFAENSDSLMHWRAYCPQKNGLAIGFSTKKLRQAELAETPQEGMVVPQISFGRVGYIDTSKTEEIDRVIYTAYQLAKSEITKETTHAYTLNDFFEWILKSIACGSKYKAFEVEDEFRLLVHNVKFRENNIQFRAVSSTLIPYLAVTIPVELNGRRHFDFQERYPWDAVESVVIGPTPNMQLTRRSVEAFFALRGMQVQITESRIPYRDW